MRLFSRSLAERGNAIREALPHILGNFFMMQASAVMHSQTESGNEYEESRTAINLGNKALVLLQLLCQIFFQQIKHFSRKCY